MTRSRPMSSGKLTDGAQIGLAGAVFRLYVLSLRATLGSAEAWDTTNDLDTANTEAVLPWGFWDKDFVFSGVMVGGSLAGFASLGATNAGVAVTMTFQNGHTLAGNLLVRQCAFGQTRKGSITTLVFAGRGVGTWTEVQA